MRNSCCQARDLQASCWVHFTPQTRLGWVPKVFNFFCKSILIPKNWFQKARNCQSFPLGPGLSSFAGCVGPSFAPAPPRPTQPHALKSQGQHRRERGTGLVQSQTPSDSMDGVSGRLAAPEFFGPLRGCQLGVWVGLQINLQMNLFFGSHQEPLHSETKPVGVSGFPGLGLHG